MFGLLEQGNFIHSVPVMVVHACNPVFGNWRQGTRSQKCKVIFSYVESAWDTGNSVLKIFYLFYSREYKVYIWKSEQEN